MSGTFDLHVRLTPKSAADRIGEMREGPGGLRELTVYVTAPPDKNRANLALIELIAGHFDVPKSAVTLLRGQTGRHKVLRINR